MEFPGAIDIVRKTDEGIVVRNDKRKLRVFLQASANRLISEAA